MRPVFVAAACLLAACAGSTGSGAGAGAPPTSSSPSPASSFWPDAGAGAGSAEETDATVDASPGDAEDRGDEAGLPGVRIVVDAGRPSDATAGDAVASASLPGWTLTWSDEFDGPDGSPVDPTKWTHDVGGTGWGNRELEYYTDGAQNAVVEGGNLVITATTAGASAFTCSFPSNGPCLYTSARLKTQGLFSQAYGRFEARIQIPEGQGLWPAFWMLGADIATNQWPACGEIDVMENIGKEPSTNHGSLHMPAAGTNTDDQLTGATMLPNGEKLGDAFHVYAVEWSPSAIRFFLDGTLYETQTPATAAGRTWEFDKPFFLLLNVAVGGTFPGSPDSTTVFPQTMKVDYVRVYAPADGG